MIIRKEKVKKIERENMIIKVYSTKEDIASSSLAVIELKGKHGKIKSTLSDRFYYVLEGSGKFIVDNSVEEVKAGDAVIIPKNTPYDIIGNFKILVVHTPPFDPKFDIDLEECKCSAKNITNFR
jgi:mannose-6-phosphate isomerase-like protein (cupin superfamily)